MKNTCHENGQCVYHNKDICFLQSYNKPPKNSANLRSLISDLLLFHHKYYKFHCLNVYSDYHHLNLMMFPNPYHLQFVETSLLPYLTN